MASPIQEKEESSFDMQRERSSGEEDVTVVGNGTPYRTNTSHTNEHPADGRQFLAIHPTRTHDTNASSDLKSPSATREREHRLDDELHMLQVERQVSADLENRKSNDGNTDSRSRARATTRSRSRREDTVDEFDVATNPLHESTKVYQPPPHPENAFAKFFGKVHASHWTIRYFTYITPIMALILIPILLGFKLPAANGTQKNPDGSSKARSSVGGVEMPWFCIWLLIVWLGLWAGRILAKCLPWPIGLVSSLFTNNSKKWRDMAKQLEVAATIFFWQLAVEISFLPIMRNHKVTPNANLDWTLPMNKVLITFLVAGILNFVEKIIIQLIAISFHLRTYQDRIEINKFQIGSLMKLYRFSKTKIDAEDREFEVPSGNGIGSGQASGARTPGVYIEKAQKQTKEVFNKFGDAAGRVAGDFTGKAVKQSSHPHQVVLNLLASVSGSQVLARRLYRTFVRDDSQTVDSEDLTNAFDNKDEAEAAFTMFDKDMNGDISMEELEAVCVEIGKERKSITASLKDLDSVVSKLDGCLTFTVFVVVVLVFISLISTSAAGVLTSAGSAVLALSWLFSASAQEFLQSILFVFVKHPFDVGDRVTIYGNTGTSLKGDDYFVKEISLLYTEFKKLEGHVVQAPNSYLNTLFILNMRRSGGVAEAIPLVLKFGTSLEQIEGLRNRLLEFVKAEKREYQSNILTELRQIDEVHAITVNVIFFFKSNWQNEGLRLQRRNKFICALMVAMQELGIEGPRMRYPGMREQFPVYMQSMPYDSAHAGHYGTPDHPGGVPRSEPEYHEDTTLAGEARDNMSRHRPRGESLAQMGRRMDFSLGMKNMASGDLMGDVHEDRQRAMSRAARIAIEVNSPPQTARQSRDRAGSAATVGRSSSISDRFRPGHLVHRGTDPSGARAGSNSVHRNRFFGRKSNDVDRVEEGMAGIPEERERFIPDVAPSLSRPSVGEMTERFPSHQTVGSQLAPGGEGIQTWGATTQGGNGRMDPRTGLVSPNAVRMTTDPSAIAPQQTAYVPEMSTETRTAMHDFGGM